jgi:hypothetical protein
MHHDIYQDRAAVNLENVNRREGLYKGQQLVTCGIDAKHPLPKRDGWFLKWVSPEWVGPTLGSVPEPGV